MPLSAPVRFRFGAFELDAATGELRKGGLPLKLQPQPLRVLQLLVEHSGQLVTRQEIQRCLWKDSTFVDFEHGINFSINQIRGALADDAEKPQYVETLPRRGYRFIAQVDGVGNSYVTGAEPTRRLRDIVFPVAFGLLAVIGITAVLFALNVHGWRD